MVTIVAIAAPPSLFASAATPMPCSGRKQMYEAAPT
jgi:hypothetical protein